MDIINLITFIVVAVMLLVLIIISIAGITYCVRVKDYNNLICTIALVIMLLLCLVSFIYLCVGVKMLYYL